MLAQGRYRPLEGWLDSLPKEMLENDPWLLYWKGASRFPFGPSIAQSYFEHAFEQFRIQGNLPGTLLGWSGIVESILFRMQDFALLDRWIQLFSDLPKNPGESVPPEVWIRVVSGMFMALVHGHPDHPEIEEWIRQAKSISQGSGSPLAKTPILFQLVQRYLVMGDYEQSSLWVRSLQHLEQSKEALPLVIIMTRLAEAMHYGLTGDHEKCLKAVSEGLRTSENTGISFLDSVLMEHGVSSCQDLGDLGMAQSMLEKILSSWDRVSLFEKALYHFLQTRQFLLRSEVDAARAQAELALKTSTDVGTYEGIFLSHLLAAQVMYRIGKHREAWTHLHEASPIAERFKSKIFEYYSLMIEAYFHFEQGDEVSGLVLLRKALALGKRPGISEYVC